MRRSLTTAAIALVLAGGAYAHTGVKNPAVMARMDSMSAIAAEMKTLGQMAKGAIAFNPAAAKAAAATIAKHAAETPILFEVEEDDPMSEAKPEIWDNFADFTEKSDRLTDLALELSESIVAENDLTSAMKSLGATCQSCHKDYRVEK